MNDPTKETNQPGQPETKPADGSALVELAQSGVTLGEAVHIRTIGPEVLGRVYHDRASTFAGRCIAYSCGLYTPPQLCLQPVSSQTDGSFVEPQWLSVSRCAEAS